MFAVPGWSVSATDLQTEKLGNKKSGPGAGDATKSRKRKRAGDKPQEAVTKDNVADLWESVVQGKKKHEAGAPKQTADTTGEQTSAKKRKKEKNKAQKPKGDDDVAEAKAPVKEAAGSGADKTKNKKGKEHRKQKGGNDGQRNEGKPEHAVKEAELAPKPTPAAPAAATLKLTPLQASMREKLVSARFRHLNETLYTRPSEEALRLFHESPEMFAEYHEGFRRQVKVWPENPVDSFLADIRSRGKAKAPHQNSRRGGSKPSAAPPAGTKLASSPLPRTAGTCTIADLGCGDARLASSLADDSARMRVEVQSYDLHSPSPVVTRADIANLPSADGSVNVAVFCLALMGTNWVDFIEEAYRVLHWKGELWIAEIKSRFGPVASKNAVVRHSVGARRKLPPAAGKKGKGKGGDNADNDGDLAVVVDGAEDRRGETDVSAFVDILRSRGFVPHGDQGEAVDLSNKMFVKMHFIKGAAPTRGKHVKPQDAAPAARGGKKAIRWPGPGDNDDEEDAGKPGVNEASVLKPCVYKLR